MNFKTTLILLVVLAAAGVFFLVDHLRSGGEKTTATTPGKLVDIDSANVKQISLTQPDGKKFVLARADGKWRLPQPVNAPADTSSVDGLVRELTGLTARGKLNADQ